MDTMATLRRSGGIEALARELGIPPAAAAIGAEALLPAIIAGFCQYAGRTEGRDAGLDAIATLLEGMGGGALAAAVMGPNPADADQGIGLLDAIFGGPDRSRLVAGYAATVTALDPGILQRMLPLLAMLVGGYLSARATGSGAQGSGGLASIGALIHAEPHADTLEEIIGKAERVLKP